MCASWAPPDGRGGSGCVGVTAHARSHQPLARSPQLARRPAYGEFGKNDFGDFKMLLKLEMTAACCLLAACGLLCIMRVETPPERHTGPLG